MVVIRWCGESGGFIWPANPMLWPIWGFHMARPCMTRPSGLRPAPRARPRPRCHTRRTDGHDDGVGGVTRGVIGHDDGVGDVTSGVIHRPGADGGVARARAAAAPQTRPAQEDDGAAGVTQSYV